MYQVVLVESAQRVYERADRPLQRNPVAFFSWRGWEILKSEIVWVWLPLAALSSGCWVAKKLGRRRTGT